MGVKKQRWEEKCRRVGSGNGVGKKKREGEKWFWEEKMCREMVPCKIWGKAR